MKNVKIAALVVLTAIGSLQAENLKPASQPTTWQQKLAAVKKRFCNKKTLAKVVAAGIVGAAAYAIYKAYYQFPQYDADGNPMFYLENPKMFVSAEQPLSYEAFVAKAVAHHDELNFENFACRINGNLDEEQVKSIEKLLADYHAGSVLEAKQLMLQGQEHLTGVFDPSLSAVEPQLHANGSLINLSCSMPMPFGTTIPVCFVNGQIDDIPVHKGLDAFVNGAMDILRQ